MLFRNDFSTGQNTTQHSTAQHKTSHYNILHQIKQNKLQRLPKSTKTMPIQRSNTGMPRVITINPIRRSNTIGGTTRNMRNAARDYIKRLPDRVFARLSTDRQSNIAPHDPNFRLHVTNVTTTEPALMDVRIEVRDEAGGRAPLLGRFGVSRSRVQRVVTRMLVPVNPELRDSPNTLRRVSFNQASIWRPLSNTVQNVQPDRDPDLLYIPRYSSDEE